MSCEWCLSENIKSETTTVYWELPDCTRAIEITETPCVICGDCEMTYQEEGVIEQIEEQLLLIDKEF